MPFIRLPLPGKLQSEFTYWKELDSTHSAHVLCSNMWDLIEDAVTARTCFLILYYMHPGLLVKYAVLHVCKILLTYAVLHVVTQTVADRV